MNRDPSKESFPEEIFHEEDSQEEDGKKEITRVQNRAVDLGNVLLREKEIVVFIAEKDRIIALIEDKEDSKEDKEIFFYTILFFLKFIFNIKLITFRNVKNFPQVCD